MQYSLLWLQRPTSGSGDGLQVGELPVFGKAPKMTTLDLHIVSGSWDHDIQEVRLASVQLGGTRGWGLFICVCACACTCVCTRVCISKASRGFGGAFV